MTEAFLGLGSNLGDRSGHIKSAVEALRNREGLRLTGVSSLYRTAPVGVVEQNDFINAVVRVETFLEPLDLLDVCLSIERSRGRERAERWGPRTLDIDILMHGEREMATEALILPHPQMSERAFVMAPLLELWPEARLGGVSVCSLLKKIGSAGVERLMAYADCETVAIVGASSKKHRYSYKAQESLMRYGYSVVPVSLSGEEIQGIPGCRSLKECPEPIDTVTIYLSPERQEELLEELIAIRPKRAIFNPGTERARSKELLERAGIRVVDACTLILLDTGGF